MPQPSTNATNVGRRDFPDLQVLRSQIAEQRARGRGWPTVVLNVRTGPHLREHVPGPLSIFWMRKGRGRYVVDGMERTVSNDIIGVSNATQIYTLVYAEPAELFNVHIADGLPGAIARDVMTSSAILLEQANEPPWSDEILPTATYQASLVLPALQQVNSAFFGVELDDMRREASIHHLVRSLLGINTDLQRHAARLPALRKTTREELVRRLLRGRDALHASWRDDVTLDDIAAEACLSKHHFLRTFAVAFGTTPHQYRIALRMEEAQRLLHATDLPLTVIADRVGCASVGSFAMQFRQHVGMTPGAWRSLRIRNFQEQPAA
jgi:AraC family transcriptional regulator